MPVRNKPEDIYNIINLEPNYLYISGEYKNNKSKLLIKHLICNETFLIDYDHWHRGQRCPKCNKESQRISEEQFKKNLEERYPGKYTLLSHYISKSYKIKVKCNICNNVFESLPSNLYKGNCAFCAANERREKYSKSLKEVNADEIFKDFEILTYKNNKENSLIKHKKCGKTFEATITNFRVSCCCPFCDNQDSKKEKDLRDFIRGYFPSVRKEKIKNKQTNRKYELDIYIPELKTGIEFNGLYLHSEKKGKDRNFHLYKTEDCAKKNIRLIHIFEDEYDNKEDIIKDKLRSILGVQKEKIYARKCSIKEINSRERNQFLEVNHIQGADGATISLGLFYNNELVAVMSFCKLRKSLGQKSKEGIYELSRFAGKLNFTIVGGFSKLLKYAIKNYPINEIITYADLRFTSYENNVYDKNGFILDHISKPSYFYLDKNYKQRLHRFNFRKQELNKKFPQIYSKDKSESEIMKEAGYDRIWDCGNLVYKMIIN